VTESERKKTIIVFIVSGIAILLVNLLVIQNNRENKKYEEEYKIQAQSERSKILSDNKSLKDILAPIIEEAKTKYPDETDEKALEKYSEDIKILQDEVATLKKRTKKTKFTYIYGDRIINHEKKYETSFTLIPLGTNHIPIFELTCKTQNTAKIININVRGKDKLYTGMVKVNQSSDQTAMAVEYNNLTSQIYEIIVTTDTDPGLLNCASDLFETN